MKGKIGKRAVDQLQSKNGRDAFLWDTSLTGFGCKATPAGNKIYVLQHRTKQQHRTTAPRRITLGKYGDITPTKARALAAKLLLEVRSGKDPAATWKARKEAPTVENLVHRFLNEYLPNKKRIPRPSTLRDYKTILEKHVVPRLGRSRIEDVTTQDVEALHTSMRATPYQANRMLAVLKQAFAQAERWGWRTPQSNPVTNIDRYRELPRAATKEVLLTDEQMRSLLNAIERYQGSEGGDPVACRAIRFAFWSGWRISEVLRLEWKNIDLAAASAKLTHTKTQDEEHRQLPTVIAHDLQRTPRDERTGYVFPGNRQGKNLTTVRKPWVRIREIAELDSLDGLGPLRIHDLRHNVVSYDVSHGTSLEIAGRNVGHKSIQSTQTYAHFLPTALKAAADKRAGIMQAALDTAAQREEESQANAKSTS